jgi:hypothetical protein
MIREEVEKKITRELCIAWAIRLHTNGVSYETLEVNPDGSLDEREEPSGNSYHTGTYTLLHTYGTRCNCDWCAEWQRNENNVQEEFSSKADFIEACIYNNDNGSDVELTILENLKQIPDGFFSDEE